MPIEIKEMVIRATIISRDGSGEKGQAASSGRSQVNIEKIVEECVEQVLSIIEQKKDR